MSTLADRIPGKPCDAALQWLADYSDPHEAIDACQHLDWLEWLIEEIGGEVQAEYDCTHAAPRAEYRRVSDAALAEYRRVSDAALAEYRRVSDAALAEFERVRGAAWAEYDRVCGAAWAECERVRDAAAREILHAWVARDVRLDE